MAKDSATPRSVPRSRRRPGSKSEAIRAELTALGHNVATREVVAALATKGIRVSAAHVSNVKSGAASKASVQSKGARAALDPSNDLVSMEALLDAKRLVDRTGGVEQAKRTLDLLSLLA